MCQLDEFDTMDKILGMETWDSYIVNIYNSGQINK